MGHQHYILRFGESWAQPGFVLKNIEPCSGNLSLIVITQEELDACDEVWRELIRPSRVFYGR